MIARLWNRDTSLFAQADAPAAVHSAIANRLGWLDTPVTMRPKVAEISEILAAPGVDLVGPLPAAIQHHTLFTAAIIASSRQREASEALIRFISSPAARAVMTAKGFEVP